MAVALHNVAAGNLQLRFDTDSGGRTYIGHQYASYPFHVCRAQYVDLSPAGLATVYLQSSAGGIFANDCLSCDIRCSPGSQAHVTTQASTIVHRMDEGESRQHVSIAAEENSFLEYLPDPLILFPRACLHSSITIRMHPSATVMLSDAFFAHDPEGRDEKFTECRNATRVESLQGELWCLDRYRVTGDRYSGSEPGIMGQETVHGTFMVLTGRSDPKHLCESLRSRLPRWPSLTAGVSTLPGGRGVWARVIAHDAVALREAMQRMWICARRELMGSEPHLRKK